MNYRLDKYGNKLSALGFGCMRFQQKLGHIDMEKAEQQILLALENGVNYYDTAYIYPGSEAAIGEIFEKNNIRDQLYIATKLPHYLIKNMEVLEKLFQEQLRRLRTDHIDYYLMHMLTDTAAWQRLVEMGIEDWLAKKQASGAIRQVGFSYHGNSETFCRLLDARDWDFCQIQYNYMDEHSQAGRRGLNYAAEKGIPVVIMEPLRGGKLVKNLPDGVKKIFAAHKPQGTPAQLALGSKRSDRGAVRYEFGGDGSGQCPNRLGDSGGAAWGGGPADAPGSGEDPQRQNDGGLHRLRLLYALPQGRGHPRHLCGL